MVNVNEWGRMGLEALKWSAPNPLWAKSGQKSEHQLFYGILSHFREALSNLLIYHVASDTVLWLWGDEPYGREKMKAWVTDIATINTFRILALFREGLRFKAKQTQR